MSDLARRFFELFLVPAPDAPPPAAPAVTARAPHLVGLLAAADELDVAAGAVAATLRRMARARAVVVCRPGVPPARHAATPAAAALAAKLRARELDAEPAGRLCRVALPEDPVDAARTLWHVSAAVEVPVVLALPGRADGFDDLLAQLDRLVLAAPPEADPDLVELARASLDALGPQTTRAVPPAGLLARQAARIGLHGVPLDAPEPEPEEEPAAEPVRVDATRMEARA